MSPTLDALAIFVFLVAALALGWHLGSRATAPGAPRTRKYQPDYFIGLNYLLNDEPDDAVDVFIDALEVNASTLETHMALATLLRRRGKADRAIAHLQGLLNSQNFTMRELGMIRIQLVRSYIAAGLFDRAERIIEELREAPGVLREQALSLALTLFQTEREWQRAIECGRELLQSPAPHNRDTVQLQVSHFYCELAEIAQREKHYEQALDFLQQGRAVRPDNVRVALQLAALYATLGDDQRAEETLRQALKLDAALVLEKLPELTTVLSRRPPFLAAILEEVLHQGQSINARQVELLASVIDRQQGVEQEIAFLTEYARHHPSPALALRLLELAASDLAARHAPSLVTQARGVLASSEQAMPQFQCRSCGFQLRSTHWLCPGCGGWSTLRPLQS
ncbi:MAG: tetratricopeptide repeat protein [Pseudomonadales bacterium]|jgi:lipopolysaccharide biosynthesis regulator YciM|nr:tetratricopeptide repeat protein [Pseudomonadales bacterium]